MPIQAGELLLFHIEDVGNTGHTAMAISDSKVVHADPMSGVCVDDLDDVMDEGHPPVRFRAHPDVAARAAVLAEMWATKSKTPFSSSLRPENKIINEARVVGVTEASNNPALLEFGYDALYRVFKWARNSGSRPFSANRGTTCCAFVTACFQVSQAQKVIPPAAIEPIYAALTDNRAPKAPKEERIGQVRLTTPSGKQVGQRPFPQVSNAGGKIGFEEAGRVVMQISHQFGGPPLSDAHQLTSMGMFLDAKYAGTRRLLERLRRDPVFWTEMPG